MADTGERRIESPGCRPTGIEWRMTILAVFIFGILSLMLVPVILSGRDVSNRAACVGNLSQLYKAMHVYISAFGKNKSYMPHTGDAFFTCLLGHTGSEHLASYESKAPCFGNPTLYVCPSSGSNDTSVTPGGAWPDYLGPARHSEGVPSALGDGLPSNTPIACDKPGNHRGGGNVLRFDGSVSFRQEEEYETGVRACSD